MKNSYLNSFCALFLTLCGLPAHAQISPASLSGTWASSCVQSQMNGKQGYTIEAYSFDSSHYTFARHWFKDSSCQATAYEDDSETGTYKIGSENTNHGFNPENTYEVAYTKASGTDLGLIWIDSGSTHLRISRGFGNSQNTMLGLFQYTKTK